MSLPIRSLFLFLFILLAAPAVADETKWRGPLGTGVYPAETSWSFRWSAEGPKELWRVEVGLGYSGIAVSDGHAYTVGNIKGEDVIFCLDANTGGIVWKTGYPQELVPVYNPGGPNAPPAIDGKWLYTFSKQGLLSCFDKGDATLRWRVDLIAEAKAKMPTWGFSSCPIILGDRLFLNANEHGIALDKNNGKILWNSPSDSCGYAAAVPMTCRNEPALAILGTRALFVVRQSDGTPLWDIDWPTKMGENSADPIPFENKLYVSTWWGMGAAVFDPNKDTKEPLWRNSEFQNHIAAPILYQGHFYGFDGPVHRKLEPGALRCVDAGSGKTVWSKDGLKGSLIIANEKLIILTNDGQLIIADATSDGYLERSRHSGLGKRTWHPPVLYQGRVYIRDADGTATCLDLN
jgi:outer membrane protein assembly factor BamB